MPLPDGPVRVRLRDVRFAYPGAEKVSLASLEDVALLFRYSVRSNTMMPTRPPPPATGSPMLRAPRRSETCDVSRSASLRKRTGTAYPKEAPAEPERQ